MSFAARSALRFSRVSGARPNLSYVNLSAPRFFSATRLASLSDTKTSKSAVLEEVPADVYGAAQVGKPVHDVPLHGEGIQPLSRQVYDNMPRTLRNMTVYGKVIIVTGGARGLGNHMARACAEAGAKAVVIFDANQDLGEKATAELRDVYNLPVSFFNVDVRESEAINAAVASVVDMYGTPDVLVHSAGIADSNLKAEAYKPEMFRRLIDINLTGSFLVAQAVGLAMMAARKPGSIVFVASMSGSIVNYPQEQSCYNASKAGLIQFAKSIASEWAKHKIRVNCISPGYMDTELNRVPALEAQKKIWKSMTPQERLGAVDELNGLCVFLASDSSAFMTGSNILIDGGYSCY